jgi:hypothetical protein
MRRVAWTRLIALALAVIILGRALWRGGLEFTPAQAAIALEVGAAVLLVRRYSRGVGVMVGAGAMGVEAMAAMLDGEFQKTLLPAMLGIALLTLGKQIDRDRWRSLAPASILRGAGR